MSVLEMLLRATGPSDDQSLTIIEIKGASNWRWDGVGVFLAPRQFAAAVMASEQLKRDYPVIDWSGVTAGRNGMRQLRRNLANIDRPVPDDRSGE